MEKDINTDVVIIGAGLTGISMACSLAQNDINTLIIESSDIKKIRSIKSDGRTCAISQGSAKIFEQMDIWNEMSKNSQDILDIRVTDDESPLFAHYDHKMVGDKPMGYIIENYHIRDTLFKKSEKYKNLKILDKTKYKTINFSSNNADILLENGSRITSKLVIGADGRNSNIRKIAGIKNSTYDYEQTGIVCTVKHELNHNGVAIEKFLPAGPFAILPMKGGHHSSLVWTEPTELAPIYMEMSNKEFLEQIQIRFSGYLGKLELTSDRFSYPLSLNLAKKYTANRLALIGDAAHGMHPIAGQGFNLGIRDIPVLTKLISNAKKTGYDIGKEHVLKEYEEMRKLDSISLLATTHALTRLFSNNILAIKHSRRIGLATVNKIAPLKKFFIKHAMGEFL